MNLEQLEARVARLEKSAVMTNTTLRTILETIQEEQKTRRKLEKTLVLILDTLDRHTEQIREGRPI